MIDVNVTKNKVTIETGYIVNRGEYKVNPCNFTFTEEYNGLIKKAIFDDGTNKIEQAILNNTCNIPNEVLQSKSFKLRVFAYEVQDETLLLRYSPTYATIATREGSYIESTGQGEVITPTQFEQYEQALHDGLEEVANVDIDAEQTETGATVTITNRQGTEKTVEILNGIDGQDGTNGQDGQDGISIDYNWSGTSLGIKREDEQDYQYVNLKGDKGDAGQIRFIVVATLPVTDIDENAIYLVPTQETSTGNIYAEYIYKNGQWEKFGETPIEVDLSDYYKKSQVYNKTEIDGMIGDIETALTNLNNEAEAI